MLSVTQPAQQGGYPVAPAIGESPGPAGGAALIPNFFNMQGLGSQQGLSQQPMRQPMQQPLPQQAAPQQAHRGLTQPNLLGAQGLQLQAPRGVSQQGMSFSMPPGGGLSLSQQGVGMPPGGS